MFGVRIHGRGGQGVVTAAELLSVAAFHEGRHAQAFPTFGSERTGAPVVSFCRIADKPIRVREPIAEPDAVIVQDPTLLLQLDLTAGLARGGYLLINTARSAAELGLAEVDAKLLTVPAGDIAKRHVGKPIPNAALLGGFAALSGLITVASIERALAERFPARLAEPNAAAAREAHAYVEAEMRELANA